jgi:ABC-type multidrug transport system fused ATPase/permease subunit
VMLADRVLFLEAGQVADLGRHADLMRLNPRYAELFQSGRLTAESSRVSV